MNLTDFNYPMFLTTDYEKKILRKCEFYYAAYPNDFLGLCDVVQTLRIRKQFDVSSLKDKIPTTNVYIDLSDPALRTCVLTRADQPALRRIRNLMRRIWITKLLNYKG